MHGTGIKMLPEYLFIYLSLKKNMMIFIKLNFMCNISRGLRRV
jgi:hypothetical protein